MTIGPQPSAASTPVAPSARRSTPFITAVEPGLAPHGLTIRRRLTLIVLAVALPMLLLSVAIVWRLAVLERDARTQAIVYSSRSIMSAVEAQLGKYVAVGQALATSPALQAADIVAFRGEAERAISGLPGAWVTLVDPAGQQVLNTLLSPGASLPRVPPSVLAEERRAFETRQVQFTDVVVGPVAGTPVIGAGVPVFRTGAPAYYLLIGVQANAIRDLLNDRRMPEGWLAGVIDRSGNFVARSLDHERWVGKPASAGWLAVRRVDGVAEFLSVEDRPIVSANSVSPMSGWAIGLATEKSVFEAPIRQTMIAATVASLAVTVLSVLLAAWAARRITGPIEALVQVAGRLQRGEPVRFQPTGVPEVDHALQAFDTAAKSLIAREGALADSELRMRLAQDAAHAGSWEWTLADNRNYWSESLWALYGLTIGACEPSYDNWVASIHADDRERVAGIVGAAAAAGQEFEVQWRVNRPAGEPVRWLLARSRPIVDANGRVDRYIGIVIDITERMRTEQALRESDRRLAVIMEALPVGVGLFDGDGRAMVSNGYFRRFVPHVIASRDEARRALWEGYDEKGRLLKPEDYPAARALRGEPVWPGLEFFFRGDEHQGPLWTRIAALPFLDESGGVAGAVQMIVDIDAEKRAQEERRTLQAELLHVSRLSEMGQMAAALAHELNQPLTAVAVYIGGCQRIVAADDIDDERRQKLRQMMQMIGDQALRAGEIIKQLRDFVRKGDGERRVVSAATLMQEASTLALTAAKHKGVEVRFDTDKPGTILVNQVQIQQVVFNLVRNAIEAMEDTPRKELDIRLSASGERIEFSVADTGTGLAPEIADRLFMPFASTKSQGMGIGLSVCRNIVEAHQGRIWAEPNPGGGTVFRFWLPVVGVDMAEDAE
ncbi:MAG: PAS domain-containing protein [Rhodoplanes sp.]|uniref:ATP-binding protein n=1 Tax=Rhodoplanes sp. TaxID=1968906 RepID=UPI00185E0BF0|nr:ATP-binding protein [Rhodoplanes sp.]NVO12455.1 PAS domain-containing protein [Rhodoplanes sp.]